MVAKREEETPEDFLLEEVVPNLDQWFDGQLKQSWETHETTS